jgi:hypothetical protein
MPARYCTARHLRLGARDCITITAADIHTGELFMTRHRSRRVLPSLIAAALLVHSMVFLTAAATAQSPTTGSLTGVITDEAGIPLSDAIVLLADTAAGLTRTATSDRNGEFRFTFLAPGDYVLSVERLGFVAQRLSGVAIRPGREVQLEVPLDAVPEVPAAAVARRFAGEAVGGGRPGATQWLSEPLARALPHSGRDLSELARLASRATPELVVEGLAPWLSALAIDGVPFRPAMHPHLWAAPHATTAFALAGVGPAQLVSNGVDVEWAGAAGGFLSGHSRRGSAALELDVRGDLSGSALPGPSFVTTGAPDHTDFQIGLAARGPLGDSVRFSTGLELRRVESPVAAAWPAGEASAAVIASAAAAGVDVEHLTRSGTAPFQALTAFGRFDWPVAARHQLAGWVQFASLTSVPGYDAMTGLLPPLEGRDVIAGASVLSTLGARTDNDLRVSITTSSRTSAELHEVPYTNVVDGGFAFGGSLAPARGEETRVLVSDAFHFSSGRHRIKIGGSFAASSHSYEYRQGAAGEFLFGGAAQLADGIGAFTRTEAPVTGMSWTATGLGVFAQDRWSAGDGLELLAGVRVDHESLPDDAALDAEWLRLSGISNNPGLSAEWLPSARVGVSWDVGRQHRWFIHGGGGIYYDRVDPLLLAQWQIDDGGARVRREVGDVVWPRPSSAGSTLPRLTVLGPNFEAPRTARISGGLAHRLTEGIGLSMSATFRRTENLPRRTDLNLQSLPAERDQYNRPVYGTLVKQGALLVAQPGSSRRFETYDEVAGITADGWSEHWSVTVGADHDAARGLTAFAHYTFGSTTDNWFAGRHGGWTVALPRGLDPSDNWAEGTSDFDVPHRAVIGATYTAPFGARLAGLYRLQSGMPFTPGFRAGVDASGDGTTRNDPAFIDASLAGVAELTNAWPCLRESAGRFAARNSCRGATTHAVDVSAGMQLVRFGDGSASVFVDVFDLLDSASGIPDAALFLVDPAAPWSGTARAAW